ncbi:MAG: SDR family oxidoreductase [Pseudomonadota bacterium]
MSRVAGKIALVTGAAQGLGEAISRMLAREGATVLLTDINASGAAAVAESINESHPGSASAIAHDVTSVEQWQAAIAACEALGGLHILVNNAGIGTIGGVTEDTLENFRRVHEVDVDSIFIGCKYAMPVMTASGGGSIINMSSIAGIIAGHNQASYNSAKAAVCHLSKSIALDCARKGNGIRCNSVHPVFIDTPIIDGLGGQKMSREELVVKLGRQIPLGRIGQPDDIAYGVLYLASDESAFVTGVELRIDGGISAM